MNILSTKFGEQIGESEQLNLDILESGKSEILAKYFAEVRKIANFG